MNNRLVAHWPLNDDSGDALDWSGNENHGTVNGATQGISGLLQETAYSFDASNTEYVDTNYSPQSFTNRTVSLWFSTTVDNSLQRIMAARNGDALFIQVDNGDIEFRLEDDGTGISTSYSSIADGEFHHFTGNWDGSTIRLYVDGMLQDTGSLSGNVTTIPNLFIGAWNDVEGGSIKTPYTGEIQDVRIYDKALTPAEIRYLYETSITAQFQTNSKVIK